MSDRPGERDQGPGPGQTDPPTDPPTRGQGRRSPTADNPFAAHSDGQETILVVDDDQDIARFVQMNLELHGFQVQVAHDAMRALELIE